MSTEDQLRQAFADRAAAVSERPGAEARLGARVRRDRWVRRGAALTAAAATVAAVLIGIVVPDGGETTIVPAPQPALTSASPPAEPSPSATMPSHATHDLLLPPPSKEAGGPKWLAIVQGDGAVVVLDARTGDTGTPAVTVDGDRATAVSRSGPDSWVFATSGPGRCEGHLHRLRISEDGRSAVDSLRTTQRLGLISDLAVSPDGSQIALAQDPPAAASDPPVVETGCARTKLTVLRTTGQTTLQLDSTWRGRDASNSFILDLTWRPDGKALTYGAEICCSYYASFRLLELSHPARHYDEDTTLRDGGRPHCGTQPLWLVGHLATWCNKPDSWSGEIAEADETSGRRGRALIAFRSRPDLASLDASGSHLLVRVQDDDDRAHLERWDSGVMSEVPLPPSSARILATAQDIAW